MPTPASILITFLVVTMLAPTGAMAQRSDADWLRECRNGRERSDREVFCEVRETGIRARGGTVSMEGLRNGGVSATGWERDSIFVRTRIQTRARSQARARELAGQVRTVINGSTITVEGPRHQDNEDSWSASLVTMIPRRSDLSVETRNGPVSVDGITGRLTLDTRNGPLTLRNLGGDVRARTTNGPLSITLSGTRWDGSGLDAQTTNGPLTINVPEGYNARLETGTRNGPVDVGFPIMVVGRINRDISTQLGSGGATIRATTTNGPLTLRRN